jgi:hypothetical protein
MTMTHPHTYITVLSDNAEELSINKAVVELDDTWVVKAREEASLSHCIHCFIRLKVSH